MSELLRNPFVAAVLGAVAVMAGVLVSDLVGWRDSAVASTYIIAAVAGAVGGYLGTVSFNKRRQ
jgi:ABC-type multidrug transport system permease subunit